jgi:hypothetical protein
VEIAVVEFLGGDHPVVAIVLFRIKLLCLVVAPASDDRVVLLITGSEDGWIN